MLLRGPGRSTLRVEPVALQREGHPRGVWSATRAGFFFGEQALARCILRSELRDHRIGRFPRADPYLLAEEVRLLFQTNSYDEAQKVIQQIDSLDTSSDDLAHVKGAQLLAPAPGVHVVDVEVIFRVEVERLQRQNFNAERLGDLLYEPG